MPSEGLPKVLRSHSKLPCREFARHTSDARQVRDSIGTLDGERGKSELPRCGGISSVCRPSVSPKCQLNPGVWRDQEVLWGWMPLGTCASSSRHFVA